MGLCRNDLSRLSLKTDREIKALKAVDSFLQSREQPGMELFHLSSQAAGVETSCSLATTWGTGVQHALTSRCPSPQAGTLHFASTYAWRDAGLQDIRRREQEAEVARMEAHWLQVRKQQDEAAALRVQIAELEQRMQTSEEELRTVRDASQRPGCTSHVESSAVAGERAVFIAQEQIVCSAAAVSNHPRAAPFGSFLRCAGAQRGAQSGAFKPDSPALFDHQQLRWSSAMPPVPANLAVNDQRSASQPESEEAGAKAGGDSACSGAPAAA